MMMMTIAVGPLHRENYEKDGDAAARRMIFVVYDVQAKHYEWMTSTVSYLLYGDLRSWVVLSADKAVISNLNVVMPWWILLSFRILFLKDVHKFRSILHATVDVRRRLLGKGTV